MTYPLGWPIIAQTVVKRERWPGGYRVRGSPLVSPGQEVRPDQPVLRLERHQNVELLPSRPRPSLPSVTSSMELQSIRLGMTNTSSSEIVPAGVYGRVVEITARGGVVIESRAAVVQGEIGVGNQVAGVLTMWQAGGTSWKAQVIPPGAILVIPGPLNFAMLRQAMNSGICGIIASSIALSDLEGFLRTDFIQLLNTTNTEVTQLRLPSMTLLLTEGLGTAAMSARMVNLLSQYQGSVVLLSGVTSIRKGIFPELIISLPASATQRNWQPIEPDTVLALGVQVRVRGGEHEGAIGIIDYFFNHEQVFASGIHTRALRLRREDGSVLIVPTMQVERIG